MKRTIWTIVAAMWMTNAVHGQVVDKPVPVTPRPATVQTGDTGQSSRPLVIGKKTFPAAPRTAGCYQHVAGAGSWTAVPCLTKAQTSKIPKPDSLGTVTQQPGMAAAIAPGGAELNVDMVALGGVTDSVNGPGMFSLQLNTNAFLGNGDNPGDQNWVQYVYQQFPPPIGNVLCIWSIDLTTQNYYGTGPSCLQVTTFRGAQTGDQPTLSGSASNGSLTLAATIPWATGGNTSADGFLVTSPDYRNFGATPWLTASGGMLGSGGSSEAVMTRSCITSTPSFFFPSTFNGATLNGQNFGNGITGEYNNLTTSNFPIASCSDGLCGAAAHGVSTDWSKTDGVKSCYPGDIPQPPLKPSTTPQATEDDSSVYTANGNHIRQCKSNALMIGVDASDSRFLCSATLPPAGKLTVDKSTKGTYVYQNLKSGLRAATLHSVHVCPANSAMVGWNQSADLLLCGQIPPSGYVPVTPSHFGADSVDGPGGTQVPEPNFPSTHLHACDVKGSGGPLAVVGIDVANNVLVCRNANSVPRLQ